jgi:hypothetical protein
MAITKVEGAVEMFEKEIVQPVRKERFTLKQLDAQILQLQTRLDALKKDKADALALTITEEVK